MFDPIDLLKLYEILEVEIGCSGLELRKAYLHCAKKYHPDKNPDRKEWATTRFQQVQDAYYRLKEIGQTKPTQRASHYSETNQTFEDLVEPSSRFEFSGRVFHIKFNFDYKLDLDELAQRRRGLREAWNEWVESPNDLQTSLKLIHVAHLSSRPDIVAQLLTEPILIDAASLLFLEFDTTQVTDTLLSWAEFLYAGKHTEAAIELLEGALFIEFADEKIRDRLRQYHYWMTQKDGKKKNVDPRIRIFHYKKILELGFELDYIYKLLAEAYYELDEIDTAKAHLQHAYEINHLLSGAKTISRALGMEKFIPDDTETQADVFPPPNVRKNDYLVNHVKHIPTLDEAISWFDNEDWQTIEVYSDLNAYYPKILNKARNVLVEIARNLSRCNKDFARYNLITFLNCVYWDVREAATTSLVEIGNADTLHALQNFEPNEYWRPGRDDRNLDQCIKLLKAKLNIDSRKSSDDGIIHYSLEDLIRAKKEASYFMKTRDYVSAYKILSPFVTDHGPYDENHLDLILMFAICLSETRNAKAALELVQPLYEHLRNDHSQFILPKVLNWYRRVYLYHPYISKYDNTYLQILETYEKYFAIAQDPTEFLENVDVLALWFGFWNQSTHVKWLNYAIAYTAPGSRLAKRKYHLHDTKISPFLQKQIDISFPAIQILTQHKIYELFGVEIFLDSFN
ncbi:MAG: DnaJ domain-containing protein [Chloroflexi bacterium]|nr:DnaJ domain-containing protein [Chloroflexota bacterium]